MASAAVHSKAMVLLLLIRCFVAPIVCVGFVFGPWSVMQYLVSFLVLFSFVFISLRKEKLVALL